MSLTNPNSVVTEERLSDFYQGILPYLGGMPDILANKFNKSDLYSTDEKIVGQWVDGKPLYQKTIISNPSTSDYTIDISELNLETLVDRQAMLSRTMSGGNSQQKDVQYRTENSGYNTYGVVCEVRNNTGIQIGISGYNVSEITEIRITLRYTKTTDSPVAIGIDTDYSTTEKIVGTWIDGKPVYQKTFNFGALPNKTTKYLSTGLLNCTVIDMDGVCWSSEACFKIGTFMSNNTFENNTVFYALTSSNEIRITCQTKVNLSVYSNCYITLQYTKNTD